MKLGIMGTGKIVQEVLPLLADLKLERCYLAGRPSSAKRTAALCEKYSLDGYFLDATDLLQADIDTVYIALPNQLHFSFAKQALLAGKHVILEKPATPSLEELLCLEALAQKKQVLLLEAVSTHYLPAVRAIKKVLPSLGSIRLAQFSFCQYSSRYDDFQKGKIAPAFDPSCQGGALMDINVYNLHALVSFFGMPKRSAYAANMQRGVDTSGIVTMEYDGFLASATGAKDCQSAAASVIIGERGSITIPMFANNIRRFTVSYRTGETKEYDFSEPAHRLSYEFFEFSRIIEERDFESAAAQFFVSKGVTALLEQLKPF